MIIQEKSEFNVKSKELFDVNELVRSLQRREGNPACFRKDQGYCDREDCFYRHWCLICTQEEEKERD